MARKISPIFLVFFLVNSQLFAQQKIDPFNLKKHHGVFCDVCKSLVDGGEKIGDADLNVWLDTNIGILCWSILLPLHHKCEEELRKVKDKLKKDIENKVPPKKACEDVDLC